MLDTLAIDTESNVSGIPIFTIFLSNDSASVSISNGAVITGRIVSYTITFWVILDELPDVSMAVHVTVVSPSGKNSGTSFVIDEIPTRSYVDGMSSSTELEFAFCASTVMFDGIINSGLVVSTTLTNCSALVVFPDVSAAVHVTVVSPSGKNSGALFETIGLTSTISVAVAVPISNIIPDKSLISITRSIGCTSVGEIVSTTLTNWSALAVFPDVSDAVHVTTVSPSGKNSGALFSSDAISTWSYTRGFSNSMVFSELCTASVIIVLGAKIFGFVVSTTEIICESSIELP